MVRKGRKLGLLAKKTFATIILCFKQKTAIFVAIKLNYAGNRIS